MGAVEDQHLLWGQISGFLCEVWCVWTQSDVDVKQMALIRSYILANI